MNAVKTLKNKISCSVVGARGYSGLELVRLLLQHPNVNLESCFATSAFKLTDTVSWSGAEKVKCYLDSEIMQNLTDVVFLATPAEASLKLAPQIIAAGKKVIDLSGAFRLKKHDYEKWYGFSHSEKNLLASAEYGLLPWIGPATSATRLDATGLGAAALIANPGCFATAVTMSLIPLLKNKVISAQNIVIDAKSGATGGGKKAAENLLFTEVDGECLPYKVGRHQHYPEIVEAIEMFSGEKIEAHFSTSLLPIRRGIIASVYATMADGKTAADVKEAFAKAYANYDLVQVANISENANLLSLKKVVGTGRTHISYQVEGNKLYLHSCIDNLLKGAASQALENFNRIFDFPVSTTVSRLEALT